MNNTPVNRIRAYFSNLTTHQAVAILAIVGLLVFLNSLFNGFVGDDILQVVKNSTIHSLSNISKLFTGSTFFVQGADNLTGIYYRPLVALSFATIYSVLGQHAFIFHTFQVLLIIANSILLFIFLKKIFDIRLALVVSIIFLVHPINEEAAVYIANLQEVLFFFFGILALLVAASKKMTIWSFALIGLLLLCSLLSKETGVIFAFLVLLYIYMFRIEYWWQILVTEAAIAIGYVLLRFKVADISTATPISDIATLSLIERVGSMPKIFIYYIQTLFLPLKIEVLQRWVVKGFSFKEFVLPLFISAVFLALIFLIGHRIYHKNNKQFKWFVFFVTWFIAGVLFHLQIIPLDGTVANRWFYLTSAGLFGVLALGYTTMKLSEESKKIFGVVTLIVIVLLSARTIIRNFDWRSDLSLFRAEVVAGASEADLEDSMGVTYMKNGYIDEAGVHFEKAVELEPDNPTFTDHLGVYYALIGKYDLSEKALSQTINLNNKSPLPYVNLATVYIAEKKYKDASSLMQSVTQKYPNSEHAWLALAVTEYKLGNLDAAKVAIANSLKLSANNQAGYVRDQILSKKPIEDKYLQGVFFSF